MRRTRQARSLLMTALVALGVVATALTPVGAGASARAAAAKPVSGGTWTIGIRLEVANLDPVRAPFSSATATGGDKRLLVFSTLMRLSKTGATIPGLAESMTTTDGQSWTMKLRPNLKFSDGTPLDADAVIFNIQRYQDPANAYTGVGLVAQIQKMTKVDDTTIDFKLVQPNGSFPSVFGETTGMMGSPTAIKAGATAFGQKPVGAGAYVLKEWVRDSSMTFVRNPNYYDKPRPYIDTIVFKILPDVNTLTQSLRNGSIDAINGADSLEQLKIARDDPKNFAAPDPAKAGGAIGIVCNLDKVPCNDVRYREALSLAFDYKAAVQVFAPGAYSNSFIECPPFGPNSPYCAKDVKLKYNPDKAKKLVDAVKADGINTDLAFTWNSGGPYLTAIGEWIQQSLAKVGVKVSLIPLISTIEFSDRSTRHEFQSILSYQQPALTPLTRIYNDYHSAGGPNGGRDIANLNNAQLDVALEKAQKAVKLADQIDGIQEAQRILANQYLARWIMPYFIGVVSKSTFHLPSYVSPNANVYRYEEAWISPSK